MTTENPRGNAAELFADTPYDAATLATMIEAYAAACHELETNGARLRQGNEIRLKLVARILKAVAAGERDPDNMKLLALRSIQIPQHVNRRSRRR